jgi:hypothetical protein
MAGTDVATLALFHPEDLVHTRDWPPAWFADAFAFEPEAAAGRFIAWSTGGDGGFKLRVTTGALTADELALAGPDWTFPYTVRHGHVLLGGIDPLTDAARMPAYPEGDGSYCEWVDIASGAYAVSVHAIDWHSQAGHGDEDEDEEEDDGDSADTLPDYVIVFRRLSDGEQPPPAPRCSPQIIAGEAADDRPEETSAYAFRPVDAHTDFSKPFAAFACRAVGPAGRRFEVEGQEGVYTLFGREITMGASPFPLEVTDQSFVVAPDIAPGAIGQLCRYVGGRTEGVPRRTVHEFYPAGRVRIEAVLRPMPMPKGRGGLFKAGGLMGPRTVPDMVEVRAAALDTEAPAYMGAELAELRERLLAALESDTPIARVAGKAADYWRRMLKSGGPYADIAAWLNHSLDLDEATRLDLMRTSPQDMLPKLVRLACGE